MIIVSDCLVNSTSHRYTKEERDLLKNFQFSEDSFIDSLIELQRNMYRLGSRQRTLVGIARKLKRLQYNNLTEKHIKQAYHYQRKQEKK